MTEVLKVHWQQKGNSNNTKKEKDTRHHKHNHDCNNYRSFNVLVSSVIVHLFMNHKDGLWGKKNQINIVTVKSSYQIILS